MLDKLLLTVIAAGLWANIAATLVHPAKADADEEVLLLLRSIESSLTDIWKGTCANHTLCPGR
jgi:hypothetical protein